jgi:hypothetical protein
MVFEVRYLSAPVTAQEAGAAVAGPRGRDRAPLYGLWRRGPTGGDGGGRDAVAALRSSARREAGRRRRDDPGLATDSRSFCFGGEVLIPVYDAKTGGHGDRRPGDRARLATREESRAGRHPGQGDRGRGPRQRRRGLTLLDRFGTMMHPGRRAGSCSSARPIARPGTPTSRTLETLSPPRPWPYPWWFLAVGDRAGA